MAITTSKKFWLNAYDIGKGFIVAALSTPISIALTSLQAGKFNIDWKALGIMAIGSGSAYLLKNLFTPSQTIITNVSAPEKN